MSTNGKTLNFRAAKLKGFTVIIKSSCHTKQITELARQVHLIQAEVIAAFHLTQACQSCQFRPEVEN